jgi:hypothetical protein
MASNLISDIFTNEELEYLLQLPQVIESKTRLANSQTSYFTIPLTESLKHTIQTKFGIDVSTVTQLPMRWITGDSKPHIDVGSRQFEHTYLAYINANPGEFIIDNTSYPISENTGFMFNEGLSHYTTNTGIMPRLLMGPMNEFALPVGATAVVYYSNYQDAYNQNNSIASSGFILGTNIYPENGIGSYTKWRIARVFNDEIPPPTGVYDNGFDLSVFGFYSYFVYPDRAACFLEGTKILSIINGEEKYVPIETLRKGDLIKTFKSGNKAIDMIGFSKMTHNVETNRIKDQLYKCSQKEYPDLLEDLVITGCHSILVDKFESDEQKEETIKINGKIYVTDKKYRLPACVDERASVYELPGTYTIYHLALENDDYYMNYGIYANGLLVETCSKRFIKEISNIILIE